ncbi:MAG: Proteasome protein [Frankiales bacterium]|jgi:proteasome accessory factor C|nr:Proteasome protein [Frankiales bacterium]
MSGALAQLPRLLALLPYLLQHPGVQTAEAADLFGVTEEQLRRDLNLLWVCGLPGHGPGDLIDLEFEGDTITLFEPAGVTRPLRLAVDEALALLVALRTLSETPGLADRDAVDRALAKIEEAAGAAGSPAQRVEVALEGEERVLPVVRDALERRRRVHLAYYVPGRDETTERDVDPMRLLLVDGRNYLEGWCRRVEAVRLFRLDRVVAISVLDLAAELPPAATERDISQGLFQPSEDDVRIVLALGPGAHWVADYYPCESVEDLGDGTVIARLRTPDTSWVERLALRLGASARVLEPPELVAQVRTAASMALAAYTS